MGSEVTRRINGGDDLMEERQITLLINLKRISNGDKAQYDEKFMEARNVTVGELLDFWDDYDPFEFLRGGPVFGGAGVAAAAPVMAPIMAEPKINVPSMNISISPIGFQDSEERQSPMERAVERLMREMSVHASIVKRGGSR
jgi:hypothetical protein